MEEENLRKKYAKQFENSWAELKFVYKYFEVKENNKER